MKIHYDPMQAYMDEITAIVGAAPLYYLQDMDTIEKVENDAYETVPGVPSEKWGFYKEYIPLHTYIVTVTDELLKISDISTLDMLKSQLMKQTMAFENLGVEELYFAYMKSQEQKYIDSYLTKVFYRVAIWGYGELG